MVAKRVSHASVGHHVVLFCTVLVLKPLTERVAIEMLGTVSNVIRS